jgi:hypothetical protein
MKKLSALLLLSFFSFGAIAQQAIQECVVENGELKVVTAEYNTKTGEKTIKVNGAVKKLDDVYSYEGAGYAASQMWFINSEKIKVKGKGYVKYGLPRVLGVTEVKKIADYDGISVFAEDRPGIPEVVYLPVRRGCEFQPYMIDCGTLTLIAKPEEVTKGKVFAVRAEVKEKTGKLTYKWKVNDGKILKGQGGPAIVVSSQDATKEFIQITLEVNSPDNCPVTRSAWVKVLPATPKAEAPKKNKKS